jgi:Flp pilus assembly pilin Flp
MAFYGLIRRILDRCGDSEAQTMAEYAVILGVITPAILIGIALLAGNITSAISGVASLL